MKYTGKLFRAEIYDDHAAPYTNVKKVYEANKDRYPDQELIVTNAHWYNGAKPCGNYKVNGMVLAQEDTTWLGLGWNAGETPKMMWTDLKNIETFVGTIPAMYQGKQRDVGANIWGAGVCRPCGRTAWGFKANGETWLLCTGDAMTPQQVSDLALSEGVTDLVILDGSGSSQYATKDDVFYGDGRTIYSYLLLWVPKTGNKEKDMKTVCIDPGHGGSDSSNGAGDYKEHIFSLALGLKLKALLEKSGVNVIMTRDTDKTVGLTERAGIANNAGANLYISIHSNAVADTNTSGLCVYTAKNASAISDELANRIISEAESVDIKILGSKLYHATFTVLTATNMPAVLVEYGFHTHAAERVKLADNTYQNLLAMVTARALCQQLEIAAPTEAVTTTESKVFYRVQLGAFNVRDNASRLAEELTQKGYDAFVVEAERI